MSQPQHKEPMYNHAHTMKEKVDKDAYATTAMTYQAASRIINVLEDLHYQMQKPEGERFKNYPIEQFEDIDQFIRDNMANLALSMEVRAASESKGA